MVAGYGHARFEIDLGNAHSILHKQNLATPSRKSLFARVFRPMGRGLPHLFILHQLNRHIAKRLLREIGDLVREISWSEAGVAVAELHVRSRLALDFVSKVRISDGDINIVILMTMHERRGVRRNLDLEHAHVLVF